MKKPVIGITGNEKTHPDDDIMMSYAAKGFVEGVKDAGGIPITYRLVIKKWPATISV
ncbi:glutamine amidotransferase, class I [Streptococcus pneumoniae]|nr:glutamine amidotransferase, class I [Streptococcus pneumoniae]